MWLAVGPTTRLGLGKPGRKEYGDRSICFSDPADNLVETWDFFHRDVGARDGVDAFG